MINSPYAWLIYTPIHHPNMYTHKNLLVQGWLLTLAQKCIFAATTYLVLLVASTSGANPLPLVARCTAWPAACVVAVQGPAGRRAHGWLLGTLAQKCISAATAYLVLLVASTSGANPLPLVARCTAWPAPGHGAAAATRRFRQCCRCRCRRRCCHRVAPWCIPGSKPAGGASAIASRWPWSRGAR